MTSISKIGLGTVQFGMPYGISNRSGQTSIEDVKRILDIAKKNNISYIDTASAYGNAEIILGSNTLNDFKVISKFMPERVCGSIKMQLDKSLGNLKLKSLYGYLAHRPLDLLKNQEQWQELIRLKTAGKIIKIGFSVNRPDEIKQLLAADMWPDLIQIPYNYFDNRFKNWMIKLKSKGCEIHCRSAFLQGLFFMRQDELPDFFKDVKATIKKLQNTFTNNLSGALLYYVLSSDFVDVLIMGVENDKQLTENLLSIRTAKEIKIPVPELEEKILIPSMWPKLQNVVK